MIDHWRVLSPHAYSVLKSALYSSDSISSITHTVALMWCPATQLTIPAMSHRNSSSQFVCTKVQRIYTGQIARKTWSTWMPYLRKPMTQAWSSFLGPLHRLEPTVQNTRACYSLWEVGSQTRGMLPLGHLSNIGPFGRSFTSMRALCLWTTVSSYRVPCGWRF